MKEGLVNGKRAVIAHRPSAEVVEPSEGALHDPPSPIATQRPTVLRRRFAPILPMRRDQLDAAPGQFVSQRVAIVTPVGDQAAQLLPGTTSAMTTPYADRRERRLDELDLRRGSRVKVVPRGRPAPSTTTIHFVPLPRLVLPTPQPLFSPERNCHPETIRSTST